MSETPGARYIGQCVKCNATYRSDTRRAWCECRKDVPCADGRCPRGNRCTGHPKTWIEFTKQVRGVRTSAECTDECRNARGHDCRCSCGGDNHGIAHAIRIAA